MSNYTRKLKSSSNVLKGPISHFQSFEIELISSTSWQRKGDLFSLIWRRSLLIPQIVINKVMTLIFTQKIRECSKWDSNYVKCDPREIKRHKITTEHCAVRCCHLTHPLRAEHPKSKVRKQGKSVDPKIVWSLVIKRTLQSANLDIVKTEISFKVCLTNVYSPVPVKQLYIQHNCSKCKTRLQ